ncbi:MAG: hypothetical protein HPM95_17905 [Alphaproteobacteria bacterium]|nr:hypothetical protein [Alphaproteobacteria bacterium]
MAIVIPTTISATIQRSVATKASKKARKSSASPSISMRRSACASIATRTSPSATPIPRVRTITCRTQPLTDLTTDKATILRDLKDMKANGNTNIHQGVVWGWRVLSPQAPFTAKARARKEQRRRARAHHDRDDRRRQHLPGPEFVQQDDINAYGYGREQRLGKGSTAPGRSANAMDQRTSLACENAKKDSINVYTVAFQINDSNTVNMMRNCASNANMAFDARSNGDLVDAFKRIAEEISKLRLNK